MSQGCETCKQKAHCLWVFKYEFNYMDTVCFLKSLSKRSLKKGGLRVPSAEEEKENKREAYKILATCCDKYEETDLGRRRDLTP